MKVSEIRNVLELVRPGLAKKDLIEQSTSVVFSEGRAWTFNDEVSVSVPIDLGITGSIPAEPLYKFLGKLPPDGDIQVEGADGEFRFSCGRSKAGIRRDGDIRLPVAEEVTEPERWEDLPEGFTEAVGRVLFSCAQGGHRPILICIHVTPEFMESCDGFRMTRVSYRFGPKDDNDLCIVGKNLEKIADYSLTRFGISGNWLQFSNEDGVKYSMRIVEGSYPDLDKFIDVGDGQEIELPAKGLEKALEWASVVADDSIKYRQRIVLEIQKGRVVVKGEGPDGWAEETVRMKYSGPALRFQANPSLLKEMLGLGSRVTVGKESMKIESDGFVHVVSLEDEK